MTETTTLYRFHWPDGVKSEGRGVDVADALEKLGFGADTAKTLEFYEVIEETPADHARHEMLKDAYQ
ncbi:MAG: hypothetical protein HOK21_12595 [Rhodospirillaceae bacterium]|jgi:hypothetical protein|nr:hypothetical protein [Rhodospirillaceae bacterium]MBT5081839.1 hypothetical protein [Rhodospirillaceae bacterium]MBT5524923.1 hypothetical protein [Rhodospirillaceae bacterium]MBT5881388.1 hypothetical protein [Rhodospirillaceae bacterium]MBT6587659.1 hypothetical protein [Rhodospirillaceae bacterium]